MIKITSTTPTVVLFYLHSILIITSFSGETAVNPTLCERSFFMHYTSRKLAISGLLIALGVTLSQFYIPLGIAKCFPIQHLINVLSAVLLGPIYALVNAFTISLLRNLLGMGSLLAFPGSMIGALLAGLLYRKLKDIRFAVAGEILGTGIIGALIAIPIATYLMGSSYGMLFFVPPFFISSMIGGIVAALLIKSLPKKLLNTFIENNQEDESLCN